MKKTIIFFTIFFVTLSLHAQKVTSVYEQLNFPGGLSVKYRIAPLALKNNDNGILFSLVNQYAQGAMGHHAAYFFDRGQQLINFIHIYNFDHNLKINKYVVDSFSRDTILDRSQKLHHTEFMKYKLPHKVYRKYLNIFDLPAKTDTVKWTYDGSTCNPFKYDTTLNRYSSMGHGYILKMDPPADGNHYILHTDNGVVHDEQHENATVIWARKPKDIDDNQYNLKNLTFTTYSYKVTDVGNKNFLSKTSKISNSFDVNFQFCRLLNAGVPVFDEKNSETILGKAFLFARPTTLSKKGQDPNKNNFEVVYCTTEGKLIFSRTITLKTEKRGTLNLLYATGNNSSVSLFVAYNTNDEGFGFLTINSDTLYQQALTPIASLNKNKNIAPNEPDIQYFMKREQIFETFSVRKGISVEDEGKNNVFAGHQLLSDGGIIIYGQRKGSKTEMVAQNGSFANAKSVTTTGYAEFFALHFDANRQLVQQYISEITINKDPVKFYTKIINNKLVVVTSMPKTPLADDAIAGLSLESQTYTNTKYEYPGKYLFVPKVISIDYNTKTISSYMPINNYYAFTPEMFHLFSKNGALYLAGFTQTQNNRTLRIEKIEF